jgi:hypothetical protein
MSRKSSLHKSKRTRHHNTRPAHFAKLKKLLHKPSKKFTEIFLVIAVGVIAKLLEPGVVEMIKHLF